MVLEGYLIGNVIRYNFPNKYFYNALVLGLEIPVWLVSAFVAADDLPRVPYFSSVVQDVGIFRCRYARSLVLA
jgi:hypothetical protein